VLAGCWCTETCSGWNRSSQRCGGLGIWGPFGFILIYATATVLFFSGAILGLAGGALFGPVCGPNAI
jgi:uncharacterized membrane protein YdjX (TVP38/TMEM64 family)